MANQKISILMEAVNKFSQPANYMIKSAGQLTEELQETTKTLSTLGKREKDIARFKGLTTRLADTRAELTKNNQEIDRLKQTESEATAVVKEHTKALQKAEQQVLEMAEAHGQESEQAANAQKQVKALTKLKKSATIALKKERAEAKKATQAGKRLASSYTSQSKELGGLKNDLGKAGVKLNSLGAQELKLAKQTAKANKALEQQRTKLSKIHTLKGRIENRNAQRGELAGQAIGTAAKLAPLVLAGKRAIEYESTFADVKKVVDFKDDNEASQYRGQMMKLAGSLGVQQQGIAEIVTAAGQSGIEKDQLLQFASSATKMSVAWDVSAEDAGETLATWRAAMGLTQKNALDLADATNYLSNNMNAKAKDIAAVMVRQGSTAMGAGFDANETAALSASLIAGGATEETAATALKNISGSLTAGYSASSSKRDAMDRLGYDPEQLASDMQQDAQGTLIGVLKELQSVSDDERGAVISELFGEEIKGAVSKLVTTLNDDKNGLISAFSKVADQADRAGSVNEEYANRANTRSHKLAQLGAKFDRMTIAIGDRLLPVLDLALPPIMAVVDAVASFAESSPIITSSLLTAAGAIGVLKAGAIAFKAIKLAGGNLRDKHQLSRLNKSTDHTSISANRASRNIDALNHKLDRLGLGRRHAGQGYGDEGNRRGSYRKDRSTKGYARYTRNGRKRKGLGRLLGLKDVLFGSREQTRLAGTTKLGGFNQSINSLSRYAGQASERLGRANPKRSGFSRLAEVESRFQQPREAGSYKPKRPRIGKYGRLAGLLGGGAALALFSGAANAGGMDLSNIAMAGADIAGAAGSLTEALPMAGMMKGAGKLFRPLDIALSGAALTSAISEGDNEQIGATAGDMAGGLGGAAAGAMAGAAIGSVVPIIGTAVGGVLGSIVGGLGGGAIGEWAGSKVGSLFNDDEDENQQAKATEPNTLNRLSNWLGEQLPNWMSEDKTAQPIANASTNGPANQLAQQQSNTKQASVNFAPVINLTPTGNPSYDQELSDQIIQRLKAELTPTLMGGSAVAMSADASLSDNQNS